MDKNIKITSKENDRTSKKVFDIAQKIINEEKVVYAYLSGKADTDIETLNFLRETFSIFKKK